MISEYSRTVFLVDDDEPVRDSLKTLLESYSMPVEDFPSCPEFLERFDGHLSGVLLQLRPQDLLVVTADHGNDPTTPSTDHSREYVPLLVAGSGVRAGVDLGTRTSFADLGQTIAENFGVGPLAHGRSFLENIVADHS